MNDESAKSGQPLAPNDPADRQGAGAPAADGTSAGRADASVPATTPRIGLALGGGGARGLAHILMLEVFDEMGLRPHCIAGTSIGAIFGAAYASGLSAAHIRAHTEEILSRRSDMIRQLFASRNEPIQRMLSVFHLRSALLKPQALLDLVLPTRIPTTFEDLQIPLDIVAADFYTQDEIIFSSGNLQTAIAASMALPALFAPVCPEGSDQALMDGGLVNPLPFDVLAHKSDITVAIDVSGGGRKPAQNRKPPRALEALVGSSQILQHTIVREKLRSRRPDILIDVELGRVNALEFHKLRTVLEAAEPAKRELREKLNRVLQAETVQPVDVAEDVAAPDRLANEVGRRPRLADRLRTWRDR